MTKADRRRRYRQRRAQRGVPKALMRLPRAGPTVMMTQRPVYKGNAQRRPLYRPRNRRRRGLRFSGLAKEVGGALGSVVGMPRLGRFLGGGLASIAGSGDYVVSGLPKQNSLAGATPPYFGTISGSTCIKHREYLRDIFSSTDFNLTRYNINPGSSGLFPWLSQMAHNFEQYKMLGFCVEFKSTSSNALASTNTALGVVGLVTQYEADDPEFENKQQFENYEGAQSCNPSQSMLHFVECAKGENVLDRMYVRDVATVVDDARFFDLGLVSIMTQGMQQANVNIGELWVSYDVEFFKPKMPYYGSNDPAADAYYITGPFSTVQPFGPGLKWEPRGTIGTTGESFTSAPTYFELTFPTVIEPGVYEISLIFEVHSTTVLDSVDIQTFGGLTPYIQNSNYDTWNWYTLGTSDTFVIQSLVQFGGQDVGAWGIDVTFSGTTKYDVRTSLFVAALPPNKAGYGIIEKPIKIKTGQSKKVKEVSLDIIE